MELIPQKTKLTCWAASIEMYSEGDLNQIDLIIQNLNSNSDITQEFLENACSVYPNDIKSCYTQNEAQIFEKIAGLVEEYDNFIFYYKIFNDESSHVVCLEKSVQTLNLLKVNDPLPICRGSQYFFTTDFLYFIIDKEKGKLINSSGIRERFESTIPSISFPNLNVLVRTIRQNYLSSTDTLYNLLKVHLGSTSNKQIHDGYIMKIVYIKKSIVIQYDFWWEIFFREEHTIETNLSDFAAQTSVVINNLYLIPFIDTLTNQFIFGVRANTLDDGNYIIGKIENISIFNKYTFRKPRITANMLETAQNAESFNHQNNHENPFITNTFLKFSTNAVIVEIPEIELTIQVIKKTDGTYLIYDLYNQINFAPAVDINPEDLINENIQLNQNRIFKPEVIKQYIQNF